MLEPVEDLFAANCVEPFCTCSHCGKQGHSVKVAIHAELQRQEGKGFWQRWQRQQVERCVTRTKNLKKHI